LNRNIEVNPNKIKIHGHIKEMALMFMRNQAPHRSGDMKASMEANDVPEGIEITVGIYYFPYTELEWISPRWRGRKNPNERWFGMGTGYLAKYLAQRLGGTVR